MENWPLPSIMEEPELLCRSLTKDLKIVACEAHRGAFGQEQYVTQHLSVRTYTNSLVQKIYALWVSDKRTD